MPQNSLNLVGVRAWAIRRDLVDRRASHPQALRYAGWYGHSEPRQAMVRDANDIQRAALDRGAPAQQATRGRGALLGGGMGAGRNRPIGGEDAVVGAAPVLIAAGHGRPLPGLFGTAREDRVQPLHVGPRLRPVDASDDDAGKCNMMWRWLWAPLPRLTATRSAVRRQRTAVWPSWWRPSASSGEGALSATRQPWARASAATQSQTSACSRNSCSRTTCSSAHSRRISSSLARVAFVTLMVAIRMPAPAGPPSAPAPAVASASPPPTSGSTASQSERAAARRLACSFRFAV